MSEITQNAAQKVLNFVNAELEVLNNGGHLSSKAYYHEMTYDFYRDVPFYEGDFADHLIRAINHYSNNAPNLAKYQLEVTKGLLETEIADK